MSRTLFFITLIFLTGCGSTPMEYQSKKMAIDEAYEVADQMVMTQHRAWKPDYFIITDRYLGWDYGSVTQGRTTAVVYNGIAVGKTSGTVRDAGERIYFNKISHIQMLDWTRKFKQWYVVSLVDYNGQYVKHVFRTRNKVDAELMMDAMTVILADRQQKK